MRILVILANATAGRDEADLGLMGVDLVEIHFALAGVKLVQVNAKCALHLLTLTPSDRPKNHQFRYHTGNGENHSILYSSPERIAAFLTMRRNSQFGCADANLTNRMQVKCQSVDQNWVCIDPEQNFLAKGIDRNGD